MSGETDDGEALRDLFRKIEAIQPRLSTEERGYLTSSLSAWTDLLTGSPYGRPAAQRTWMGVFQPGEQPSEAVAYTKIGPVPDDGRPPMAELMDALAGVFAALARIEAATSRVASRERHDPDAGKIGR